MFALVALLLIACYNSLVDANPLGPSSGQVTALIRTLPTSTSASSNISAPRIVVQCSDDYGIGLNLGDCEDAIEHINPATENVVFADRDDDGKPHGAVPLPWRLMGGRCIVTAISVLCRCVICGS